MSVRSDLPADLTLEINQGMTPDQFLSAARHFFGYVEEVASTVLQGGDALRWQVRVKEGSTLLGMVPQGSPHPQVVKAAYARIRGAIRAIEEIGVDEARIPERATQHLKALSLLTSTKSEAGAPMRLWVGDSATLIGPRLAHVIQEDWRTTYADYGTVEGRLEAIQDSGGLQLRVRDPLLRASVRCNLPDDMLAVALDSFRKRVEISGLIHYRKNGDPTSIDVREIVVLPSDDDLPTANDVRGILRMDA